MKIFKNILIFLLSAGIATFFVISSFAFQWTRDTVSFKQKKQHIEYFRASVKKDENGVNFLDKQALSDVKSKLQKSEVWYIEFWRLASAFFLPNQENTLAFSWLVLSGNSLILPDQTPWIISLYDPFSSYKIRSASSDFAIEQMTNGSFYIWKESDGTISIYAIDGVGRLEFLNNEKYMTDMVVFPGMYIRFDPRLNATLEWADLFRIMLSMESDGTRDQSQKTTWVEFVNPRMNDTDEKDTFFMYRLPIETRILFKNLHVLFHDRVARVDLYKDYNLTNANFSDTELDAWLYNPSKKNHFLLQELNGVLSDALRPSSTLDKADFIARVTEIYNHSQSLALGNSVQLTLEQFLTDGRFALFGGTTVNKDFPDIYKSVSEIVGIAPDSAKTRLFQRLSDIYSRNLVSQKKDFAFSKIDTYSPTSLELAKTLESKEIEHKDYFDIALYAFYVFSKTEENRGMIASEALYATPTYELLGTLFRATNQYVRSIEDPSRKLITYKSIAIQFYDHVLSTLVRSLYTTFMTEHDGVLYLKENFVQQSDSSIKLDKKLIADFQKLASIISIIRDGMKEVYKDDVQNTTFLSIQKSITQFQAFVRVFDDGEYIQYVSSPYRADLSESGVLLPQVSVDAQTVLTGSLEILTGSTDAESTGTTLSPILSKVQSILPMVLASDIVEDRDFYTVKDIAYRVKNTKNQTSDEIKITFTVNKELTEFIDLSYLYDGQMVSIVPLSKKLEALSQILRDIPAYNDRIYAVFSDNPTLRTSVRVIESSRKIVIGNYTFDY